MSIRGAQGESKGRGMKVLKAMTGGVHALQDNRMLRMRQAETATRPDQMMKLVGDHVSGTGGGDQGGAKVALNRG